MAILSEVISWLSGGGHNGSRPYKNRTAALEALFAETEKNLEALTGSSIPSSAAFDLLNGQLDLLKDSNGTAFAVQNAYGQVHSYIDTIKQYEQLPPEEKSRQYRTFVENLTVQQGQLSETLAQLKRRLKTARNS